MINIIEAGKFIRRQSIEKLVADLQVYTIRDKVSVMMQTLFAGISSVVCFVGKLFGKKLNKYIVVGFDIRHRAVLDGLANLNDDELYTTMIRTLEESIWIPYRHRQNADVLSAYLVKFASKGFKHRLLDGLSVSEKVEYIFEKYPHLKAKDEEKLLRGWFWGSFLLAVLFLLVVLLVPVKKWTCILLCIILEMVFAFYISRKMRIRWSMYYIWLARTAYGRKLVEAKLQLDKLNEQEVLEAKENLQYLHSYLWILGREEEKLLELSREKQDKEKQIEKNLSRMVELQERGDSDTESMRKNLAADNNIIKRQKRELIEKIGATENNISYFKEEIATENKSCADFYLDLWKVYSEIVFDENVCVKVIDNLCFEDLSKVEQRLYELNYAKEPLVIAEHKGGKTYLSFRTEQGDIAKLFFEGNRNDKKIVISAFQREDALKIVPLTKEDIERISKRKNDANGVDDSTVLEYIKRIEELSDETKKLREEKLTIDVELQSRVKEIGDMSVQIADSAKRLSELEAELKKACNDKEQAERIAAEYEEKQKEFIRMSKEVDERKKELVLLKKKCDELTLKLKENNASASGIQKELEERNKILQDNIDSLESTLKIQTQIAEDVKNKQQTDAKALKKLEDANEKLKRNLENTRGELERLQKVKADHLKRRREDEEQLAKYKAQLALAQSSARQSVEAMKIAQEKVSTEKYHSTYSKIKTKFPHLSDNAMAFFATAEQFYLAFGENEKVDYSMIIVEYCKVLEISLWAYLNKSDEYQKEVQNCLKERRGRTLGSAAHIAAEDKSKTLGNYSTDLLGFAKMRNDGAHKGVQGKAQTDKIKKYLWTSGFLTQITEK